MKYLAILSMLVFVQCEQIVKPKNTKTENLSLFIMPEYKDDFAIKINDSLTFTNYINNSSSHGPQELIQAIKKVGDRIKINLRIHQKDTAFTYKIRDIDSLIFGLDIKDKHFIVQSEKEYIWYYD